MSDLHWRLRLLHALEGGLDKPWGTAITEEGELVRSDHHTGDQYMRRSLICVSEVASEKRKLTCLEKSDITEAS